MNPFDQNHILRFPDGSMAAVRADKGYVHLLLRAANGQTNAYTFKESEMLSLMQLIGKAVVDKEEATVTVDPEAMNQTDAWEGLGVDK